jgi:flavin reductase (DIM6/NTAB) family NADH-FMN oxidoreductase RutF/rubredoxin
MGELNSKALWDISYGLYIVTSISGGKSNGQIANTAFQVSNKPAKVAVSINKENLTHEYIKASGVLAISTLEEDAPLPFIGIFGFKSGREIDKLLQAKYIKGETGCPIVTENCLSWMEGKVVGEADAGTHTVFIAEITSCDVIKKGKPLTYAVYQDVKKGKAPKTAPTYKGDAPAPEEPVKEKTKGENMQKYVCGVCGYIYDPEKGDAEGSIPAGTPFDKLPAAWTCPVCGAGKDEFSPE